MCCEGKRERWVWGILICNFQEIIITWTKMKDGGSGRGFLKVCFNGKLTFSELWRSNEIL